VRLADLQRGERHPANGQPQMTAGDDAERSDAEERRE
jgi:hypothetical protein